MLLITTEASRLREDVARDCDWFEAIKLLREPTKCLFYHMKSTYKRASNNTYFDQHVRFFFFLPAPGAPFGGSVSWGVGPLAGVAALVTAGAGVADERIPRDSGGTLSPSRTDTEEEKEFFE
jgi:hypothetical protein